MLAARGEETAVLELRDLAMYMREFWQDFLYTIYEKAGARMEQQYAEKFDQTVTTARASRQPPAFNVEKATAILHGLSVHAEEEAVGNENLYSVWRCSRLAKRIWDEYPSIKTAFHGDFTVDTREQYTELGSTGSVSLPEPDQQANEWLRDIQLQIKRLTALTNDLIYLSKMEEDQGHLQMTDFSLSDLTDELVQSFQALAKARGQSVHQHDPAGHFLSW